MRPPLTEEDLFNLLSSYHPLSVELRKDILVRLRNDQFLKTRFLLKEGSVNDRMYYILEGLVHCYYGRRSQPDTDFFMTEGEILIVKESFYEQTPSPCSIEAMEDVKTLSLSYADLALLYEKHIEFNIVGRKLTEFYHRRSDFKSQILRQKDPADRYTYMKQHKPWLIDRVPGRQLASFMGLARETLSRIMSKEKKMKLPRKK
jgi:CRP-like cAMP-binding protein